MTDTTNDSMTRTGTPLVLWHNPACSASRAVLTLLQDKGLSPVVIDYLREPPTLAQLQALAATPGLSAREILRLKEPLVAELGLDHPDTPDDAILAAIAAHPVLLNRPLLTSEQGGRACRPAERAWEIVSP